MHRYNYPIHITLEGGEHATGNFIVTGDKELTPDEQEQRRTEIEESLNKQADNPLMPGAKFVLKQAIYKQVRG
jgi:hypothetical protein